MLSTGTVVAAGANVFGTLTPPKYVPPFAWGCDGDTMTLAMYRSMGGLAGPLTNRAEALHEGFGERTRTLREQLRAKRQELRQAEQGTTFNEALASQKAKAGRAKGARMCLECGRPLQSAGAAP